MSEKINGPEIEPENHSANFLEDDNADERDDEEDGEEDGEEENAEGIADGTMLEPGPHFLEIATLTPCRHDVLLAGMSKLGFDSIRLDQSRARSAAQLPVREHRFLAHVSKRVVLHQTDHGVVRWLYAQALTTDMATASDIGKFRLKLEAYPLEKGALYETVFLSRERSQPTRQIVEEHLDEMGFFIEALTCIQRDMRLADRPGVSTALWFGLLEWTAPPSVVTEDDPFYFERLTKIAP